MPDPLRLLLADDHQIVRQGMRALLGEHPGLTVVGEAADGQAAVDLALALQPDVILMDLSMPRLDGLAAIRQIVERWPPARILVLTSFATDDKVFPAIQAGALGYLLKETGAPELLRAIQQVARGEPSLDPAIARKVLQEVARGERRERALPPTPDPLTSRELEVLRLLASGAENRAIAEALTVSEVTVRTHVSNILAKLHLANRVQAALYALREGLTSLDDPSAA